MVQVADSYRWLEDPDANETKQFVDDQNALTRPFLEGCVYKNKIKENITKLWNYPKYSVPFRYGKYYYQYRNTGRYLKFVATKVFFCYTFVILYKNLIIFKKGINFFHYEINDNLKSFCILVSYLTNISFNHLFHNISLKYIRKYNGVELLINQLSFYKNFCYRSCNYIDYRDV